MKTLTRLTLAALLAIATACSSGDTDDGSSEKPESSEDVADLSEEALALDDLPAGWAEDNSEDDSDDDTLGCLRDIDDDVTRADVTGRAEVAYMEGTGIPSLTQLVAQYPDADAAAAANEALDAVLDACGSFEEETDDGEPFTGQIGKVSLPQTDGADSQVNYQFTAEAGGVSVSAAMIGLQVDTFVTFLYWVDVGSFDPDAVAEVATTAVAKLGD